MNANTTFGEFGKSCFLSHSINYSYNESLTNRTAFVGVCEGFVSESDPNLSPILQFNPEK